LCVQTVSVWADERVTFDSASYQLGALQQRQAHERGEAAKASPGSEIVGYLSRPAGHGPFAAIVYMHGCGGLTAETRRSAAEQMTGWGYVTLVVDSFATRGVKQACVTSGPDRQADAFGALLYLSKLPFVDARRIALVGHSQGGIIALEVASYRPYELYELPAGLNYKAAVAFYPLCTHAEDELAIPALVLIGELDDWSPLKRCEQWMRRRDGRGAPVKMVVYPGAYHSFDVPGEGKGRIRFGHWLEYSADAAARSASETHDFLAAQLAE
ncbi:MAG: dienelactone hydrolase family protein, partial [Steroidobacteraceae bacterium]